MACDGRLIADVYISIRLLTISHTSEPVRHMISTGIFATLHNSIGIIDLLRKISDTTIATIIFLMNILHLNPAAIAMLHGAFVSEVMFSHAELVIAESGLPDDKQVIRIFQRHIDGVRDLASVFH